MLEQLDRRIGDRAEQAFAFLEALVRAPSMVGAEQGALEIFEREARSLDLLVERLPFAAGASRKPTASRRIPSVSRRIASRCSLQRRGMAACSSC